MGVVITADTASFELMKEATLEYYSRLRDKCAPGAVEIQSQTDKSRKNIVQYTIRVERDYTVNIYLTTCKFMVNGKHTEDFLIKDLVVIKKFTEAVTLDGKRIDISAFNDMLTNALQTAMKSNVDSMDGTVNPAENNTTLKPCLKRSESTPNVTPINWHRYRVKGAEKIVEREVYTVVLTHTGSIINVEN